MRFFNDIFVYVGLFLAGGIFALWALSDKFEPHYGPPPVDVLSSMVSDVVVTLDTVYVRLNDSQYVRINQRPVQGGYATQAMIVRDTITHPVVVDTGGVAK